MRNINFIAITLFSACFLALSGCGDSSIAPVSGTVTFEGKPVPNLQIIFSPIPTEDNSAVGPFSSGKTDADGKFSLKTKQGASGAFVGNHRVSFEYTDLPADGVDLLVDKMLEAQDEGKEAKYNEAKQKMAELKAKLKERPNLEQRFKPVSIPAGGSDDLKLELSEMAE